jgi:hypothetical protein
LMRNRILDFNFEIQLSLLNYSETIAIYQQFHRLLKNTAGFNCG